jgi:hypothetical protein
MRKVGEPNIQLQERQRNFYWPGLASLTNTQLGPLLFKPDRSIKELKMRYTPLQRALAKAVAESMA